MRKDIGLDIKPPKSVCEDSKCPWHGNLKIRGQTFIGFVVSTKPEKTAIVEWNYNYFNKKYERFERRKSRVVAHNPKCLSVKEGEKVIIGECRPLSKTKKFCVLGRVGK